MPDQPPVQLSTGLTPGPVNPLQPYASGDTAVAVPGPPGPPGTPVDTVTPIELADAIEDHRAEPTPHYAYDDMPSLTLIYENGLV